MRFDDRLDTVLRVRVNGPAAARIQYHQLLDLLGTMPAEARGPTLDAAYVRLNELSQQIPAADRAATLALPATRLRSPRLVAALAGAEPVVAGAAMRAARLSDEQWLDLIPALPPAARGAMRDCPDPGPRARALLTRLGVQGRALPPGASPSAAEPPVRAAPEAIGAPKAIGAPEAIGAIVQRIEAYRRARTAQPPFATDAPRLPLDDTPLPAPAPVQAFDFTSDASGRINWAEARLAPMVVGRTLGQGAAAARVRRQQPLRAVPQTVAGSPLIAGAWLIDAVARFDPAGGRFAGYVGRFRRAPAPAPAPDGEADQLRQVLHELRTPVNAIQGFAEIIQQQLFGPTPHEYRALAAAVAADAARMLAGFEELDRLARLSAGALDLAAGHGDFAACVAATVARLAPREGPAPFRLTAAPGALPVVLAPTEAERLCWRLLATLAGAAAPGEVLTLKLGVAGEQAHLSAQLPAALAALDDAALLHAGADAPEATRAAGMFGTGFALRLAMAEARGARGELTRQKEMLNLLLPLLTTATANHSHGQPGASRSDAT